MEGLNKNLIENDNNEDFNFLSEEELLALNDEERALYYRRLEKRAESDMIEHHKNGPEIDEEKLVKQQEKKLDKLYKKDPNEPYWQR